MLVHLSWLLWGVSFSLARLRYFSRGQEECHLKQATGRAKSLGSGLLAVLPRVKFSEPGEKKNQQHLLQSV